MILPFRVTYSYNCIVINASLDLKSFRLCRDSSAVAESRSKGIFRGMRPEVDDEGNGGTDQVRDRISEDADR